MDTPNLNIEIKGHLIDGGDGENYQFPLNIQLGMGNISGATVVECAKAVIVGFALRLSASMIEILEEQTGAEVPDGLDTSELRIRLAKSMLMDTLMNSELFKNVDASSVDSPLDNIPVKGE
ncbi:MAG: hypothetical protein HDQ88_07035 [Clostridia bacterium]|nr:hypothetical protein [Clostridia bacterium]